MPATINRRQAMLGLAALTSLGCATGARAAVRRRAPWIDGLSFLPDNPEEVTLAKLDAMVCDISKIEEIRDENNVPRYLRTYEKNSKALDAAISRIGNSPYLYVAHRGSDILSRQGCAVFLQFQSCEPVGTDLSRISDFHARGLRILQFTHHNNNAFAGGALERQPTGLTNLGREGLAEMNRVGIVPDVSHGSEATMLEVAQRSSTPVLLSHGACKAIVDHPRCASDAVIRAIAEKGGMMGIFMMSFWLTKADTPMPEHLVAHIRHVIRVGGADAVGIANDFPMAGQSNLVKLGNNNKEGVKEYWEWWAAMRKIGLPGFDTLPQHVVVPEFNHIDRMSRIADTLDRAGFRSRQIEKIMGGNWRRVLTDILG